MFLLKQPCRVRTNFFDNYLLVNFIAIDGSYVYNDKYLPPKSDEDEEEPNEEDEECDDEEQYNDPRLFSKASSTTKRPRVKKTMKPAKNEPKESNTVLSNLIHKLRQFIIALVNCHGASIIEGNISTSDLVVAERKHRYVDDQGGRPASAYSLQYSNFLHQCNISTMNSDTIGKDGTTNSGDCLAIPHKFYNASRECDREIHTKTYNNLEFTISEEFHDNQCPTPVATSSSLKVVVSELEYDEKPDFQYNNGGGPFVTILTETSMLVTILNESTSIITKAMVCGTSDTVLTDYHFPFKINEKVPDTYQLNMDEILNSNNVRFIVKEGNLYEEPIKEAVLTHLWCKMQVLSTSPVTSDVETKGNMNFGNVLLQAIHSVLHIYHVKVTLQQNR
jgi:hypothetical protein